MDLGGLRKPYNTRMDVFLEDQIFVKDPIDLFSKWFQEACSNSDIVEPNAMCLSTATRDGIPSGRFVLCKGFGQDGFRFYTHYTSRKGQELEENPNAALTFHWAPLNKSVKFAIHIITQSNISPVILGFHFEIIPLKKRHSPLFNSFFSRVRIEGTVEKLPISYAEEYFKNRPYQSQIGALCSDQSKIINSRQMLVDKSMELRNKYKEGQVPRPEFWGGYRVVPTCIEFWQGQTDRIHDRIKFRKVNDAEIPDNITTHCGDGNWVYERLQP